MIHDFFTGLRAGLSRDPLIWALLILNALAAWAAYAVWFQASPEEVTRGWAELRAIFAGGPASAGGR
jgi:hypothetical protein